MKTFVKLFLTLFLMIGVYTAKSQKLILGATGNLGFSKVSKNTTIYPDPEKRFAVSGNLGLFLEKKVGPKSSFGVEALWVQIEGLTARENKATFIIDRYQQDLELISIITDRVRLHSSYIGIPIYYRLESNGLGLKVGFQSMLLLSASLNYEASGVRGGEPFEYELDVEDLELNRLDIGPKVGIDYRLGPKLLIRADYYHGLNNMTVEEYDTKRKNRQLSLGLSYAF